MLSRERKKGSTGSIRDCVLNEKTTWNPWRLFPAHALEGNFENTRIAWPKKDKQPTTSRKAERNPLKHRDRTTACLRNRRCPTNHASDKIYDKKLNSHSSSFLRRSTRERFLTSVFLSSFRFSWYCVFSPRIASQIYRDTFWSVASCFETTLWKNENSPG